MKIYACPPEVPAPEMDFKNFNYDKMLADEAAHVGKLKAHMVGMGFKGENTGEVIRFPVADGSAQYMFADAGAKSVLIHLPYGDAYSYRDAEFIPRTEILKRIKAEKTFKEAISASAKKKTSP